MPPASSHAIPFLTRQADAPGYWQRGLLWNVVISAEATFGEFTMLDQTMAKGAGPPWHRHERMAEGFFVLDGTIEYRLADREEPLVAGAGDAVWIPRGTAHAFTVTSEHCRALNFYTPGGFDDHFPYLATPATAKTLPPPDDEAANDPQRRHVDPERNAAYLQRIRDLHEETFGKPD